MQRSLAAFFDIGDTLASVATPDDGSIRLTVLRGVREVLDALTVDHVRLGIISNPGTYAPAVVNQALAAAGLLTFFEDALIIYGKKDTAAIFAQAAQAAGLPPNACTFVGEAPLERQRALDAGFLRVSPHPRLTRAVLRGEALVYVSVPSCADDDLETWQARYPDLDFVPVRLSPTAPCTLYAVATVRASDRLRSDGLSVTVIGGRDRPLTSDL